MGSSVIILLLTSCFGILFIVMGLREGRKRIASRQWPATVGAVVRSEVTEHTGGDVGDAPTYTAEVEYTYVVNGVQHTADRIAFGYDSFQWREGQAARKQRSYPVGARVNVYYNPLNPSDAVLERGSSRYVVAMVAAGVGLVIVGIALSQAARRFDAFF